MSSFPFHVDNWFIQWLIQWPKYKNQSFDCKYFPQLYNDAMNYTNWWMRPFDYFRNFQEISVFLQCETEARDGSFKAFQYIASLNWPLRWISRTSSRHLTIFPPNWLNLVQSCETMSVSTLLNFTFVEVLHIELQSFNELSIHFCPSSSALSET